MGHCAETSSYVIRLTVLNAMKGEERENEAVTCSRVHLASIADSSLVGREVPSESMYAA